MLPAMHPPDLVTVDPEILGGTPVFRGTRVPVKTLFEYLEDNYSLEEFVECFPSVPRELALFLAVQLLRKNELYDVTHRQLVPEVAAAS